MESDICKKQHRKKQSGPKAGKNKDPRPDQDLSAKQRNPKAFAVQSVNKTTRLVQRTLDIKSKKHHIPLVDRTPVEPPPVVVAIVGPPKVGKSTLLQCLVKNFTKQKLSNPQGPITVVSGKHRRLTLMECNNDINSMIDIAKVADLVLLLVDASFGFEMEIFEFLNICQVHGFPKIMGVLTHLDSFKDNKRLKKTKKRLKHRFWTEVYQGAKLFYLSGMVNREYQKREVHNLCRFVSVMKFRPLLWRMAHPYILADRLEDITDPGLVSKTPKSDRTISVYGYVRGTHFKNQTNIHIPGCGDYKVHDVQFLPDPCPTPDAQKKRRSLNEKEQLIYSPMSGVGGVVYDKDAVYIDLGGSHSHKQTIEDVRPMNELVSSMMSVKAPVDDRMTTSQVSLFSHTAPLIWDQSQRDEKRPTEETVMEDGRTRRRAIFSTQDDHNNDHDDGNDDDDEMEETEDKKETDDETEDEEPVEKKSKVEKPVIANEEQLKFADSEDELQNDLFELHMNNDSSKKEIGEGKIVKTRYRTSQNRDTHRVEDSVDKTDEMENSDTDSDNSENSDIHEDEDSKTGDSETDERNSDKIQTTVDLSNRSDKDRTSPVEITKCARKHGAESKAKDLNTGSEDEDDNNESDDDDIESDDDSGHEIAEEEDNESDDTEESSHHEIENEMNSHQSMEGKIKGRANRPQDEDNLQLSDENDSKIHRINEDMMEINQGEEKSGELQWKSNMVERAAASFRRRQEERINYRKLIYGQDNTANEETGGSEDELGGLFTVLRKKSEISKASRMTRDGLDCSVTRTEPSQFTDVEEVIESIRDCFVTGKWEKSQDAETLLKQDDELFGDFEDLETGQVFQSTCKDDADGSNDEDNETDEDKEDKEEERVKKKAEMTANERRQLKKRKLKDRFDSEYDTKGDDQFYEEWKLETEQQAKLNREEFDHLPDEQRVQYEGFRPGMYVRVEVKEVPCELVTNFDPHYPIILGGLQNIEGNVGYVQARVKKHRWHKKILKTRNPLIISLGWRRFQSIPLYYIQDHNFRNRLLKYTPEHLHCQASFWGPITPQGTGLLAIENVSTVTPGFRIAATGVVLELDKSIPIVKKLKLTGTPFKIFKKTAFIQGMFNSKLEVAKFEGASIRTVSGIRGQIKKALSAPEGAFRATFEDKIIMSDVTFVRTWFDVQVPQFYNPVTSLLLPREQKAQWSGMKTVGQLRFERSLTVPAKKDSQYKLITRANKGSAPLVIPRHLQKELPFKDTPKHVHQQKTDPFKRVSVIREPREAKVAKVLHMLKTLHEHKMKKVRLEMRHRAIKHQKETDKIEVKKERKQKEVKKEIYRVLGQIEKKNKNKRE